MLLRRLASSTKGVLTSSSSPSITQRRFRSKKDDEDEVNEAPLTQSSLDRDATRHRQKMDLDMAMSEGKIPRDKMHHPDYWNEKGALSGTHPPQNQSKAEITAQAVETMRSTLRHVPEGTIADQRERYSEVKQRVMERREHAKAPDPAEREEMRLLEEEDTADPEGVSNDAVFFMNEIQGNAKGMAANTEAEAEEYRQVPEHAWLATLTEDNYIELVEEEVMPVIIDCHAPQCMDSVAVSATLKCFVELVNTNGVKMKLLQLDTNTNYALTMHLDVNSLPTTLAVHDGEVLETVTGMGDEESIAQFVFGYANAIYGEEGVAHITEDLPLSRLIDARVALKAKEQKDSMRLYRSVLKDSLATVEQERKARAEGPEYTPEVTRPLSTAEVLAAKAACGVCINLYQAKQYRLCRQYMMQIIEVHDKAYRTLSDVRKTVSSIDIMLRTDYQTDVDVADLEDEERIDQHNLDIKVKLIGAYFMEGSYRQALSAVFILIRKNRQYKNELGIILMMRIMMYLGRHNTVRAEYEDTFEELLRLPYARAHSDNQKVRVALSEPNAFTGVLEEEIPLMIDPTGFAREAEGARHPLLR